MTEDEKKALLRSVGLSPYDYVQEDLLLVILSRLLEIEKRIDTLPGGDGQ